MNGEVARQAVAEPARAVRVVLAPGVEASGARLDGKKNERENTNNKEQTVSLVGRFPSSGSGRENTRMNDATLCTPALGPSTPFCEGAGTAGCLDSLRPGYAPKRLLRAPVVTVRGRRNTLIAFNASLARELKIARFKYAAVQHDPVAHTAQFTLSNDELAHGGSYKLGFNGGTGKKKGSPSRAFPVPRERVPFLQNGAYRAEARETGAELVVTIHLDQPIT